MSVTHHDPTGYRLLSHGHWHLSERQVEPHPGTGTHSCQARPRPYRCPRIRSPLSPDLDPAIGTFSMERLALPVTDLADPSRASAPRGSPLLILEAQVRHTWPALHPQDNGRAASRSTFALTQPSPTPTSSRRVVSAKPVGGFMPMVASPFPLLPNLVCCHKAIVPENWPGYPPGTLLLDEAHVLSDNVAADYLVDSAIGS